MAIEQNLISEIDELKNRVSTTVDSPITDLEIQCQKAQFIFSLTQTLEFQYDKKLILPISIAQ